MKTIDIFGRASAKMGENIVLESLLRMTGRLKNNLASQPGDVVGFDYLVLNNDSCFEFYMANAPMIGITQPLPINTPLGIEVFSEYNIDYKEAISLFQSGKWGNYFTSMALCKPLANPGATEPYWYLMSNLNISVVIGANSGKVVTP